VKNNADEKPNSLTVNHLSWTAGIFTPLGRSDLATVHLLPPWARLCAEALSLRGRAVHGQRNHAYTWPHICSCSHNHLL